MLKQKQIIVFTLGIVLAACSGGGGGGAVAENNANLSSLTLDGVGLDQIFQSAQLSYTASSGYLKTQVKVNAVTAHGNASMTVNGVVTNSGVNSHAINLAEGSNTITIVVTSDDGSTSQTYSVDVNRQMAANFAQQAYLKASNAEASDQLGWSVALDGDTLAVGAFLEDGDANSTADNPNNNTDGAGAVYVFTRNGTVWTQQAYLKASNPDMTDLFGGSVALSGDTLAVGAFREDGDANSSMASPNDNTTDAGAAYVFTRNGTSWSQQAYLKAANAGMDDWFGYRVALEGDTLVVGAYLEDGDVNSTTASPNDNKTDSGGVYVFTRSGTSWSQQAYLKASNAETTEYFGFGVALSGDTLVAGAYRERGDVNSTMASPNKNGFENGAAYVFTRNGTSWSQQAYLKASNSESFDRFGYSVAIDGDTLAVGAIYEAGDANSTAASPNNNTDKAGAVYVYTRTGTSWSQQAYLKAGNPDMSDFLGVSVALSGDILVATALREDGDATSTAGSPNEGATDAGAAYVFTRSGTTWTQQLYVKAGNAGMNDIFGIYVAFDNGTLVIGAQKEGGDANSTMSTPNDNASDAGAVYVFK